MASGGASPTTPEPSLPGASPTDHLLGKPLLPSSFSAEVPALSLPVGSSFPEAAPGDGGEGSPATERGAEEVGKLQARGSLATSAAGEGKEVRRDDSINYWSRGPVQSVQSIG